jgi:hypothetical protein
MKRLPVLALAAGLLACLVAPGSARENTLSLGSGQRSPEARIEEVEWIAGHWTGSAFGGVGEEVWSHARGRTMMGMYRLIKDEHLAFYELLTITEEDGTLVLRLKHFNADLTGWEEREEVVTFPLVKLEPDAVHFDGMTFRRVDEDKLQIFVRQRGEDERPREVEFVYDRVE